MPNVSQEEKYTNPNHSVNKLLGCGLLSTTTTKFHAQPINDFSWCGHEIQVRILTPQRKVVGIGNATISANVKRQFYQLDQCVPVTDEEWMQSAEKAMAEAILSAKISYEEYCPEEFPPFPE